MKRFLSWSVLVFLTGISAGCSSSPATPNPGPSGTTTWYLTAGGSSANEALQTLQYYPSSLTIDAGDTVTWRFPSGEPHTVTLVPPGQSLPPETSPTVQSPAGGNTYDGTTYTSSGFVLLGGTYSLTFTKAGTYKVYCLIHQPEMVGTITVNPAGTPYPIGQTGYNAEASNLQAADLASAAAAVQTFPYTTGGLHLIAGISAGGPKAGPSRSTVVRFLNSAVLGDDLTVTVPVGGAITWTNYSNNAPHTVTFGIAGQPFPTLAPFSPPSGGPTYDGTVVTNSGPLLPGQSYTLAFTVPGTYTYHCLFHDDTEHMIATVVVH